MTIGLVNLDFVIDKYQTYVRYCQPLVACRLMPSVTRGFIVSPFFLVDAGAFGQSFCRFIGAATVNIFL